MSSPYYAGQYQCICFEMAKRGRSAVKIGIWWLQNSTTSLTLSIEYFIWQFNFMQINYQTKSRWYPFTYLEVIWSNTSLHGNQKHFIVWATRFWFLSIMFCLQFARSFIMYHSTPWDCTPSRKPSSLARLSRAGHPVHSGATHWSIYRREIKEYLVYVYYTE